jgi:hypothetical protein
MVTTQAICNNCETERSSVNRFNSRYAAQKYSREMNYCPIHKSDTFEKTPKSQQMMFTANEKSAKNKKERHFFKALASLFITGGGQILDGRFGDGIKQNLLSAAISLGGYFGSVMLSAKGKLPLAMVVSTGATVAFAANKIHSIIDAYRGGDKD